MRTRLAGVLLLASIASCVELDTESTNTNELYGLGSASPTWGSPSGAVVQVCWEDPDSHLDLQIRVREILRETWESYANISFTGPEPSLPFGGPFGPCSETTGRRVHVSFSEMPEYPGWTGAGTSGGTAVILLADRALAESYTQFRYEVIHEFGHALGFLHEQQRPDNWPYGTPMQCLPTEENGEGNYLPVAGGLYLTPTYDVNSIMNYCNPAGPNPQDLSLGDIRGVRSVYGRRDVKGDIYKIDDQNQLRWYRHDGRTNGSTAFAFPNGPVVGTGWDFKMLFSGGGSLGILYTLDANNTLNWWRHDGRVDGGFRWAFGSGNPVGYGWNFAKLFGAGDGVIYAISPRVPAHYETVSSGGSGNMVPASGGDLYWYRHKGAETGVFDWDARSGTSIGTRWDTFAHVFYAGNGVIYGITPYVPGHYNTVGSGGSGNYIPASGGDLYWYRNLGQANGTKSWAAGSGKVISHGWGGFKKVFSGGDGVIYGVDNSDQLYWYRHDDRDTGGSHWAAGSGSLVSSGWSFQQLVGDD